MPRGRCSAIKYLLDNLDVAGVAELATAFASPESAIRSFGAFNARLRELVKTNAVPAEEETSWAKMHSMADSFAARGLYLNTPNWQGPVLVRRGPRKGMVADPGYCSDPRGPTRARPRPTFHELQPEPLELSDRDRELWPASTISSA